MTPPTVEVHVEVSAPPAPIETLAADGAVLAVTPVDDPRHRSVILPDGTGETALLPRAIGRYTVPWPAGAARLRQGDRELAPRPPPTPAGVVAVQRSGSPSERLDLLFLGDGYTADQQARFAADVDALVAYLGEIEPYGAYTSLLNIWRVDTASTESGVTHLETGDARDTAFDCYYGCGGIDRLVCCDDAAVLAAVAQVGPVEGVVVLINDPVYGGSGGFTYATAYNGDQGLEVAAHELGHSLVLLRDEYAYGFTDNTAFTGPNCSADGLDVSWAHWLGVDGVGAYEVCSYDNFWRPTENACMMRTLDAGYCPVCREAAVLAMYAKIPDLLASTDPPPGEVDARTADLAISVTTLVPAEQLAFEWAVDGEIVEGETGAELRPHCRPELSGEVTVRVFDPTAWVREDPQDLLQSTAGPWTVLASDCTEPADPAGCGCRTAAAPLAWLAIPGLLAIRRRR